MPQATYHFPRGFLWGTATAAHQVEGNNTNNQWWQWEQDGHTDGKSGLASDWWGGRWKEDFDAILRDRSLIQEARQVSHIRNIVCHMSAVPDEAEDRVKLVMRDWFRAVAP